MDANTIDQMIRSNKNFFYCTYEVILNEDKLNSVIFVNMMDRLTSLKTNVWNYVVNNQDLKKHNDNHDWDVVKSFNGNEALSLTIVEDTRLRRR